MSESVFTFPGCYQTLGIVSRLAEEIKTIIGARQEIGMGDIVPFISKTIDDELTTQEKNYWDRTCYTVEACSFILTTLGWHRDLVPDGLDSMVTVWRFDPTRFQEELPNGRYVFLKPLRLSGPLTWQHIKDGYVAIKF